MQSSITQTPFGQLPNGRPTTLFTMTNQHGLVVKVTDFGAIITEIHTPDRDGRMADITLGFDELAPYLEEGPYFGAFIGRYGNRLCEGRFAIDGQHYSLPVNNKSHHLHGGPVGFNRVPWSATPYERDGRVGVSLTLRSLDGDQGYPGQLDVTVVYELTADDELLFMIRAVTDQATPVNLTQHVYFNLAGQGDILGHELHIDADAITAIDATLIPTGELAPVAGTAFDFRSARPVGERIGDDEQQLHYGGGYDHNFVLNKPVARDMTRAARVRDPVSGRVLELLTQEPGVQFYSGNFLDGSVRGKGQDYAFRSGLCLEPQHFPDSPNQPTFPNTILRPGQEYATVSTYKFSVER